MPKSLRFGSRGLYLNSNPLSDVPEGALAQADNVVIQRDGIVESRRGYVASADFPIPARADTLVPYAGALLLVPSASGGGYDTLSYNGTAATTVTNLEVLPESGLHVRTAEALRRLYFVLPQGGLYRYDGTTYAPAGVVRPPDGSAALTGASGFLAANQQVAYRYHWTRNDARGVPMQGPVSGRVIATNPAGAATSVNVVLTVPVPIATVPDMAVGDYLEVYRSAPSASAEDAPGDDMAKVYEHTLTGADVTAGYVTITDVVPEGLRAGATLYTSPNSGDGILADKAPPPAMKDVALYAGRLFAARTTEVHRVSASFLTGTFTPGDLVTFTVMDYVSMTPGTYTVGLPTGLGGLSAGQAIEAAARAFANAFNTHANLSQYGLARYVSGEDDVPGTVVVESYLPRFGFSLDAGSVAGSFSPRLDGSSAASSTNSEAPNGLAFSNADEPDAWPLLNRLTVGNANAEILRLAALQDALYVFKEDGLWRLTGTGPEDFTVRLFDGTVVLAAPSSVVSVGGRLFALTNQGVVAVSETGVEVVSRQIEPALLPLLTNAASAVSAYAFGVSVESDREYRLYLPSSSADTYATQCYRYNLLTRAWTRTTEAATHGVVFQGKVHLGHPTDNALRVERRTYAASDYQDEGGAAIDVAVRWQVDAGGDPGALKRWRTAALTFEAPAPQTVGVTFSTELSTATATQAMAPVAGVASCYVPQEKSRSATLTLGFTHAVAGEKAASLGAAVGYQPSSDRTGR